MDKKFTEMFSLNQVFIQFPNWQIYSCPILLDFAQILFCKKYRIDKTYTHRLPLTILGFDQYLKIYSGKYNTIPKMNCDLDMVHDEEMY